jgi:hypothetical protein
MPSQCNAASRIVWNEVVAIYIALNVSDMKAVDEMFCF